MNHKQAVQKRYPLAACIADVRVRPQGEGKWNRGIAPHAFAVIYNAEYGSRPCADVGTYVWEEDVLATGDTERDAWRKASRLIARQEAAYPSPVNDDEEAEAMRFAHAALAALARSFGA
jgi:hypothetical protein